VALLIEITKMPTELSFIFVVWHCRHWLLSIASIVVVGVHRLILKKN